MSSSDIAMSVRGLSKHYVIQHEEKHTTLSEKIMAGLRSPLSAFRSAQKETFQALSDVSFDVNKGEVVGIIGRNGAGKSTLLKILSRITEPTAGRVDLHGRVGSLLEVGTGFHPELTGRENIYLNGAILGMRRSEIRKRFDEIVAFAEVERFLDTPVKRYSSGMYVRLAFAVAAHLEPEILIVDEVLAVGDAQFQKKCLGKMKDVSKDEGRTVLFVSHNMAAVDGLCGRVIWLEQGAKRGDGTPACIIADYNRVVGTNILKRIWDSADSAPGTKQLRARQASISCKPSADSPSADTVTVRTPLEVAFEFWNFVPGARLNLSMNLFSAQGVRILNSFSQPQAMPAGLVRGTCTIPGDLLNDGTHSIELMIVRDGMHIALDCPEVLVFEVADVDRDGDYYGKRQGLVRPRLEWAIDLQAGVP